MTSPAAPSSTRLKSAPRESRLSTPDPAGTPQRDGAHHGQGRSCLISCISTEYRLQGSAFMTVRRDRYYRKPGDDLTRGPHQHNWLITSSREDNHPNYHLRCASALVDHRR